MVVPAGGVISGSKTFGACGFCSESSSLERLNLVYRGRRWLAQIASITDKTTSERPCGRLDRATVVDRRAVGIANGRAIVRGLCYGRAS